jgi:hypothetical protein
MLECLFLHLLLPTPKSGSADLSASYLWRRLSCSTTETADHVSSLIEIDILLKAPVVEPVCQLLLTRMKLLA